MMTNTQISREGDDYIYDQYTATGTCRECATVHTVKIPAPGLFAYNNGAAVQTAFPLLSDADRELLFITGICGDCWNDLFPDED